MRLVLASRNQHKLVELRLLCGLDPSTLVSALETPGAPDPEENGATFVENALIKARALRDFSGEWALADDSGLCVDALRGAPGVRSARYCGRHGDDAANNARLLADMDALGPSAPRTCRFSCALALVSPEGREFVAIGQCPGRLLREGRGTDGFGYELDNCTHGVLFRVDDTQKFYNAQIQVGNHVPFVYGDYYEEMCELGRILGLEVLAC